MAYARLVKRANSYFENGNNSPEETHVQGDYWIGIGIVMLQSPWRIITQLWPSMTSIPAIYKCTLYTMWGVGGPNAGEGRVAA